MAPRENEFDTPVLEREEGGEEGERNIDWLPLVGTPTDDQTCNPGMCPAWDLNLQPFVLQVDSPTNWATGPGLDNFF